MNASGIEAVLLSHSQIVNTVCFKNLDDICEPITSGVWFLVIPYSQSISNGDRLSEIMKREKDLLARITIATVFLKHHVIAMEFKNNPVTIDNAKRFGYIAPSYYIHPVNAFEILLKAETFIDQVVCVFPIKNMVSSSSSSSTPTLMKKIINTTPISNARPYSDEFVDELLGILETKQISWANIIRLKRYRVYCYKNKKRLWDMYPHLNTL